jgi:hypothetical protein
MTESYIFIVNAKYVNTFICHLRKKSMFNVTTNTLLIKYSRANPFADVDKRFEIE